MAAFNREIWKACRAGHEVNCLSVAALSKIYGMSASAIDRKIKAEGWSKGVIPKTAKIAHDAIKHAVKNSTAQRHLISLVKEMDYLVEAQAIKDKNDYHTAINQTGLINNQSDLQERFNPESKYAHAIHKDLVTSNKNLDNSNLNGTTNNLNVQQNTQINIYNDMTDDDIDRRLIELESRS